MRRHLALAVALTVAFGGCGSDSVSDADADAIDGGPRSEGSVTTAPVLASEPTFVLGGLDVPAAQQFGSLRGVAMLTDGSFWIAEWQTRELRRFDADGAHVRTVGGDGQGPGEFQDPELIGVGPGDSLFVVDQGVGRLTVFTEDGELGRTSPFFNVFDLPLLRPMVLEDGAIAALVSLPIRVGSLAVGDLTPDSGAIVRIEYPRVDTIGWYRSSQSVYTGGRPVSQMIRFTGRDDIAVVGDRVLATTGADFAVRDVTANTVLYSVERPPRPVDEFLLDALRDEFGDRYEDPAVGESALARIEEQRDHLPEHTPGYDLLLAAPGGEVWARPWAAGNSFIFGGYPRPGVDLWDVFTPSLGFIGQVATPGRLAVVAVGEGFVIGSRIDDFGVVSLERIEFVDRRRPEESTAPGR